jgi:hypothetical protein
VNPQCATSGARVPQFLGQRERSLAEAEQGIIVVHGGVPPCAFLGRFTQEDAPPFVTSDPSLHLGERTG